MKEQDEQRGHSLVCVERGDDTCTLNRAHGTQQPATDSGRNSHVSANTLTWPFQPGCSPILETIKNADHILFMYVVCRCCMSKCVLVLHAMFRELSAEACC